MPQGTGERTGNLLDWSGNLITINGTVTTNQDVLSSIIDVSNINTLYFTGDANLMNSGVYRLAKSNSIITFGSTVDSYSSNFTDGSYDVSDCNYLLVTASVYAKPSENRQLIKDTYMCNTGSEPLPYEPYGYKIPISSANTTTNIYLGEVQTTRRVRKLVFDGSEAWSNVSGQAPFQYLPSNFAMLSKDVVFYICDHYKAIPYNASWSSSEKFVSASAQGLRFEDTSFNQSLDDFKSYLAAQYAAGTPVTVWYVLATEETGIVNEPLMKIGDYADSISKAQTGVEIPTIKGNNTLDIDTTVKPSNVYIKYKD